MKRHIISISILVFLPAFVFPQNIGIGTNTAPTRAKLEVHGVSMGGRTSGIFGGDRGISLMRNIPAIGFNMYNPDSLNGNGKYLGSGYAAMLSFTHNDPTLSKGMEFFIYPSGTTDASIPAGIKALNMSNNGRFSIMTIGNAVLEVGRGTGGNGTAMFQGTNYQSHINYSTEENTYIRCGKSSTLFINDITDGKVIFGDGAARVGVNTSDPVYTFEIRQVAGTGLRMANSSYPSEHWEWRVSESPAKFYLYHQGVYKNYLHPADGSMHPASDARLKTNVQPLTGVLDKILKLRPATYEMINDNPQHIRSIGFIAQEVSQLFPQLTFGSENSSEMMTINYSGFNVLAVAGIQEQQPHLIKLENKTADAERRMLEIEKKINAIKTQHN